MSLLEVGSVHEVIAVAVSVQEFHLLLVHIDLFNRIRRAETMLEHGAGTQVAQFGLDEGAQIARRAVLHAEDRMQIIVVLDDHAGAKLGGRDSHCGMNLLYGLRLAGGSGRATFSARHWARNLYFTRGWGKMGNLDRADPEGR